MTAKPDLQPLVHGHGASCTNSKFKFLSNTMFHPTCQLLHFDDISSNASSYFTFIGMLDLLVLVFWFAASTCCWQHILIVKHIVLAPIFLTYSNVPVNLDFSSK